MVAKAVIGIIEVHFLFRNFVKSKFQISHYEEQSVK